jgi:hypothetical protein
VSLCVFLLAASLIPGCQKSYFYKVRGTVKNAIDGKPLRGVSVACSDTTQLWGGQPGPSGRDGSFSIGFYVDESELSSRDPKPTRTLVFRKDGFFTEWVNIDVEPDPESQSPTTPVIVVAYLRPKT